MCLLVDTTHCSIFILIYASLKYHRMCYHFATMVDIHILSVFIEDTSQRTCLFFLIQDHAGIPILLGISGLGVSVFCGEMPQLTKLNHFPW